LERAFAGGFLHKNRDYPNREPGARLDLGAVA